MSDFKTKSITYFSNLRILNDIINDVINKITKRIALIDNHLDYLKELKLTADSYLDDTYNKLYNNIQQKEDIVGGYRNPIYDKNLIIQNNIDGNMQQN